MAGERPVLISVIQYQESVVAGTTRIVNLFDTAHRLGADGVELRPQFLKEKASELPAARERAADHGLLVTYATMGTLYGTDASVLRQDIDDARALGSSILRIFPGLLPAEGTDPAWETGRAIARYAEAQGVTLALENFVGTPGGTLAEIQRGLDTIPSLATNIDIGNYPHHDQDVVAAIGAVGARAVSAHLKDHGEPPGYASAALGDGILPLGGIMDALDRLPQRLLYIFEFGGGDNPDDRIARSLAYLRAR
ncbi:MAG: sugar phosphate isomerase/epimerase family protein [Thermomicrobiales bacterium]